MGMGLYFLSSVFTLTLGVKVPAPVTLVTDTAPTVGIVHERQQRSCQISCRPGTHCVMRDMLYHRVGLHDDSADQCRRCPAGTYQNSRNKATRCKQCWPGRFRGFAMSPKYCRPCPNGKYQTKYGALECTSCPPGKFRISPKAWEVAIEKCDLCPRGKYQGNAGRARCSSCTQGTFAKVPTGAIKCTSCSCNAGTMLILPPNVSIYMLHSEVCRCRVCTAGKFSAGVNQATCVHCPPGKFSDEHSRDCTLCALGRFAMQTGTGCDTTCPHGKHRDMNRRICVTCPSARPFRFRDNFESAHALTCFEVCPLGYRADAAKFCLACDTGTRGIPGGTSCELCQPGRFQPKRAAAACDICPAGKFQRLAGARHCSVCQSGYFSGMKGGAVACQLCNAEHKGLYFQNEAGQRGCKLCPAGRLSSPPRGPAIACARDLMSRVHATRRVDTIQPTPYPTPTMTRKHTRAPTPCPEWKKCEPKRLRRYTQLMSQMMSRNVSAHMKLQQVAVQYDNATSSSILRKLHQHVGQNMYHSRPVAQRRWWDNAVSHAVLTHSPIYLALCFALILALLAFTVARMIARHQYERSEQSNVPVQLQNRTTSAFRTFSPLKQEPTVAPPHWAKENDDFIDTSNAYQMPVPSTYY